MNIALSVFCLAILAACLPVRSITAQPANDDRGRYFSRKEYTPEVLPAWDAGKARLPRPVLEAEPGWVEMYWKCWELAFDHLRRPEPGTPFVSNYVDEAFNDNIFQWDTIFMVMFWRYAHHIFPAVQSFNNFYCLQHSDGFICREIRETGARAGEDYHLENSPQAVNPPLFSWAETEYYRVSGDKRRFEKVLPVLEKYAEWLEANRMKTSARHGLYWQTGLGSGMDNTPQTGSAWVEMSAQMVVQYNDLAFMADEIGLPGKAKIYRARARDISDKMNRLMWDESSGFYWNLDDENVHQKCKAIGFAWTLLAGIPSAEQAERLAGHLMDPGLFYRNIPFASLSADSPGYDPHGGYWLGSSWAPTTYQAIKGLQRYGYEQYAAAASEKYLAGMYAVFEKTGTVWENYAPDFPEPGNNSRRDFVGWSGCGPIALLLENVIGLRPDAVHNRIVWHLRRTDRHGVEGLVIGNATLTLLCEKRQSAAEPAVLTLKTDKPFQVIVVHPNGTETIDLKAGTTRMVVKTGSPG